ncbi:MAG: amidohydrolase family protein [Acidobacteria bacterium]|nr:amidohydrolase family protein [Acidobacteriota bacterium]
MITRLFVAAAAALLLTSGVQAARQPSGPDTIFYNGSIISVDDATPLAEAFAVKDDRFVAVGGNAEVRALATTSTRVVDLRGHTVVPGLMDNHNHQYHVALLTRRGVDVQNNPFVNIYYYVTRVTRELGPLGVDQNITRPEAWRVETLNNAYLTFEERIKGSITPRKLADFVILSDNLLTVPEAKILTIHPLATYVGGRKVYTRPDGGF